MPKPIRVLLIAEAANPSWTSVPLVGWSMATAILRATDGHLITQVRNQQAILEAEVLEKSQYTIIDSERVAKPVNKFGNILRKFGLGWTFTTALSSIPYAYFEYLVWKKFKHKIRSGQYDIVHRITPLSPTLPSPFLAKGCAKAKIPFILGPINGGVPWPKEYSYLCRREGEWLSYIRNFHKLNPWSRQTFNKSSAIITGSWTTRADISPKNQKKCVYIVENAIDPSIFPAIAKKDTLKPIKVAFVGRLVPLKMVDVLIESTAELMRNGKIELEIFGDGPELPSLEKLIQKESVSQHITMHGWVSHEYLGNKLSSCDVLGFPSIREFGGGVVLESMAMGLVPVVIDYAGPSELVTKETGFKIPMGPKAHIVNDLSQVFENISRNPEQLSEMREAGQKRIAEHFTWDAKATKILEVYRWITHTRSDNPEDDASFLSSPFSTGCRS